MSKFGNDFFHYAAYNRIRTEVTFEAEDLLVLSNKQIFAIRFSAYCQEKIGYLQSAPVKYSEAVSVHSS